MKKSASIFLSFAVFFLAGYLHADVKYTLIDLGTMGNDCSFARSINNYGAIAGGTGIFDDVDPRPLDCVHNSTTYAFKWVPVRRLPIPTFPGLPWHDARTKIITTFFGNRLWAESINDLQEMTGTLVTPSSMTPDAIIWDRDGNWASSVQLSSGNDINNSTQVVGDQWGMTSWLWDDGDYVDIVSESNNDCLGSFPNAINDSGHVVGSAYSCIDSEGYYAYLWMDGKLFDLNERIGNSAKSMYLSEATDINEVDLIIGECEITGRFGFVRNSSFLLSGKEVIDLGFTGAKAINDHGQIVGSHFLYDYSSRVAPGLIPIAVEGALYDLNDLITNRIVYTDLEVEDINNAGQIVGSATIRGAEHAVLLDPVR